MPEKFDYPEEGKWGTTEMGESSGVSCPHCGKSFKVADMSAADRKAIRSELSSGKKAFEATQPASNVHLPMQFLEQAIKAKEK